MRERHAYASVLASAVCCYAALGAVVRIVPGYVGGTLGGSALAMGFAVGAPALTGVLFRPLGGRLADRHGPRRVVIGGGIAMALAALPMLSTALEPFVISRLAVGIGEGAMMSATVLWLLRLAGPERRGAALGHVGVANYAGLAVGPLLAELLGGAAHPSRIFVAAVLLPLAPIALTWSIKTGTEVARVTAAAQAPTAELLRKIIRPGLGLLLVNVGYAALLAFGAQAVGRGGVLVLPAYAGTVIAVRTFGGRVPDRLGGRATLAAAAPLAALGLLIVAVAPSEWTALAGVVALGVGQGYAVPALGLLALAGVEARDQGAASGLFFAWFDLGVALGGPLAGALAGIGGPSAALLVAATSVFSAALVGGSLPWLMASKEQPRSTSR